MRVPIALSTVVFMTVGCAASVANRLPHPDDPSGNVVVVADREGRSRSPRGLTNVPPGTTHRRGSVAFGTSAGHLASSLRRHPAAR